MIRAPHVVLRELYRRAGSASQLMARLGDAEKALEPLAIANAADHAAEEVFAPLLAGSVISGTLAADLLRLTQTHAGESEGVDASVSSPSRRLPVHAGVPYGPPQSPVVPQGSNGAQDKVGLPYTYRRPLPQGVARQNANNHYVPEIAAITPPPPVPPAYSGVRRVDVAEADRHLLGIAQRAGLSEFVGQPVSADVSTDGQLADKGEPAAATAQSASEKQAATPKVSLLHEQIDRNVDRIDARSTAMARARSTALSYPPHSDAGEPAQQRVRQPASGNVAAAMPVLAAHASETNEFAEPPLLSEAAPRLRGLTGLRRLAALATTSVPLSPHDAQAQTPAAPVAAAHVDVETFEAQLLLSLQRAARRDGIDVSGVEP
jgi:hypothetical protein